MIDVASECIRFKELGKTVPIQLTDRKLFRLDLLELLKNAEAPGTNMVMMMEEQEKGFQVSHAQASHTLPSQKAR